MHLTNKILLFLMAAFTKMSGYMYSPTTQDFICKTDILLKRDTIPLKFELESYDKSYKRIEGTSSDNLMRTFKIVSAGGKSGNDNFVSLKKTGEAKIFRGMMCQTMRNGFLTYEMCAPRPQQVFIWVPENKFSKFVDIIGGKYKEQKNYYKMKNDLSTIKDTVQRLEKTILEIKQKEAFLGNPIDKPHCKPGNNLPPGVTGNIFNNYIKHLCTNSMNSDKCKKYNIKRKLMCLKKHLCTDADNMINKETGSLFPNRLMKDVESILSSSAVDLSRMPHREHQKNRLKTELLEYQRKERSLNRGCDCRHECIKNPKNGLCYYQYDANGELKPLMKNEACCKMNKEVKKCATDDMLDAFLCNLENNTDYNTLSSMLNSNSKRD